MAINGVSHVAVGVSDMDRALSFYIDVVGLHPIADKLEEFPGLLDEKRLRRRAVYLAATPDAKEAFLVLDEDLDAASDGAATPLFGVGIHHFSLWVDDLEPVIARSRERGYRVVVPPTGPDTDYWMPDDLEIRSVFLVDADGNYVQLDQR